MSSVADRIPGIYQRHARAFDALRGRSLFERSWLDAFRELLPENASVLDLGCGSGEPIARYLAETGCRITGLDLSEPLLEFCRARLPQHEFVFADMRHADVGRRFDGIIAWDSFFHLTRDDQRAMFGVFAAHAHADTALMFTSGPAEGEAIGTFEGEPLYHSSLDPVEYRALLFSRGFEVVAHTANDPECEGRTVWLARRTPSK